VKFDSAKHNRHSNRLKGYDYCSEGMYFVTICIKDWKSSLLGEIVEDRVRLSSVGEIVRDCWRQIPDHFGNARLDEYVIMPNHVHGVVMIEEPLVGTRHAVSPQSKINHLEAFAKPVHGSLSTIMRSFKSAASRKIHEAGHWPFAWQSRFYEHIIRDGKDLDRIREYIRENPLNWEIDEEYPQNIRMDAIHRGGGTERDGRD
jgi:putative transposase